MRKFLTIFSFCFIFTILYSQNIFAVDFVNLDKYRVSSPWSYDGAWAYGSNLSFTITGCEYMYSYYNNSYPGSMRMMFFSTQTYPQYSGSIGSGGTGEFTYTYNGVTYYFCSLDFNWNQLPTNFIETSTPVFNNTGSPVWDKTSITGSLIFGQGNPFDGEVLVENLPTEPEESSLLDFKDISTNIGSPYKVKEVSFLTKLGDFFGSGLSGKIPQYNDSFYNLPNIDIVWSSPASLVGGDNVGITFTLSGEISFYRVNDANRVGLPLNYTLVLADKDISLNTGFSTYQAKFDSILTDYIIQNKAIFEDSSGQTFADLYRYFRLENKVRYIGLQAFADINGVPFKGAPSTIDFSSGSPVVKYGVTVEDVVPDGNYSVDSNNDYSGTVSGDTIIYNTEGSTTYIYNYITNNNYPANSVTSSNVVDGLGLVNTMLRNVPGMLQTALSGTDAPSSGVKLVISFLTVALGVALALRFFGIFFK